MKRRELLSGAAACAGSCILLGADALSRPRPAWAQDSAARLTNDVDTDTDTDTEFPRVEARYYEKMAEKRVECRLCPNRCRVASLERGTCGVRENVDGVYYTLVHSRAVSVNVDPIEKKPLFHFLPGTTALSLATAGCNMECKFCQNWQISQYRPEQVRATHFPPAKVHAIAKSHGATSIAYTYTEPTIYYEYMFDTAAFGLEASKTQKGSRSAARHVMISAGFIEAQPLRDLLPLLDAIKIDLKSFRQEFYDKLCKGRLKTVLETLEIIRGSGKWLEIVVLVVPTWNDSDSEIRALSRWVKSTLGADVPVHFTRFHPTYRLRNLPVTPTTTLERCRSVALDAGLSFVYLGNVPGHPAENTLCPDCDSLLIERSGMSVVANRLEDGRCPKCRRAIPGVWS